MWQKMLMFKIDDKIKLKTYEEWGDHKIHRGKTARIIRRSSSSTFDWRIVWRDGKESQAKEYNMVKINMDWDEEFNESDEKCLI